MSTLARIDKALEQAAAQEAPRAHFGMSQAAHPCRADLWHSFRWSMPPCLSAGTLRNFADGHHGEAVMADRLRMVPGIELYTHDAAGNQYRFLDHGGHFGGSIDGAIRGISEHPGWAVWEHKQVGENNFNKLTKTGSLVEWNKTYFGQASLYMHYSGMDAHFLTVATPGGRNYQSILTLKSEATEKEALRLKKRALEIITASEPPQPKYLDPTYYLAKWNRNHSVIYGPTMARPTGRNSVYVRPVMDGQAGAWYCSYLQREISLAEQYTAPEHHLFIPALIKAELLELNLSAEYAHYKLPDGREFWNSHQRKKNHYTSAEIAAIAPELVGDAGLEMIRNKFDGRVGEMKIWHQFRAQ